MPKNQPELKLISLEDVAVELVRWLWYPYIPLGKLTILHGDPGEGKEKPWNPLPSCTKLPRMV